MIDRDGNQISLWQDTTSARPVQNLLKSRQFDVIIVGAGITGVTTALMLQKAGKKCAILEAKNIGYGTTGGTTAHLNTLLDTPYPTIIKNFGAENASLIARGAEQALAHISNNVKEYFIECGFERCNAFLFAQNKKQTEELNEILEACIQVGLPAIQSNSIPVPIDYQAAMAVSEHAKFHPLHYVQALAEVFINLGGVIHENSRVIKVNEEDSPVIHVETETGFFDAHHVIYATHVPPGITLIHLRYMPLRSYAMAVRLRSGNYPEDLAYDMHDPYHYYRTQEIEGEKYLIVGGEDHKTGDDTNTEASFRKLESHIRTYFDVENITHRWSSQYYEPADGIPYIGVLPGHAKNILTATGFGGNGMTYGTLSALVLTDIILNKENRLIDLLSPSRIKPIAGFKNFVEHNTDVLKSLMGTMFSKNGVRELAEIAPMEGRLIEVDNQSVGVYRDELGALHTVHAACTHMGCNVKWNQSEKSWDCPCHGARYDIDGTVLNGPANRDLEYINLELVQPEGNKVE